MKYKSISYIETYLQDIIIDEYKNIISKLSNDYNIPNNLLTQYINDTIIKKNITYFINKNIRCLGIIKSGAQCARTRKCNSIFCKIHQKTLKFGKIIYPNVDSPEYSKYK